MKRRLIGSVLAVLMLCAVLSAMAIIASAESSLPKVGVPTTYAPAADFAMLGANATCGNKSGDILADSVMRADGKNLGSEQNTEEPGESTQKKKPGKSIFISDASILSEGSLTIICTIAAAAVFGVGGFLLGRRKKRSALADGEETKTEE